ncbi:MAG: redoxin family protein [Fimbriimonadaceae bacterium]|nr:redoxin family protein [Fimbriimonadaceae bacterium]
MSLAVLVLTIAAQAASQAIPKAELPKRGRCVVCAATSSDHGEERIVAGLRYRGTAYYFCSSKESVAFAADPESFLPLPLPRSMPAFDLSDGVGVRWNGDAFKGRTILVDFWASWCGPCHKLKPMLDRVRAKHRDRGFEMLSVSIDEEAADVERFLRKGAFPNPVLHDTAQTWSAWRVKTIPSLFLVRNGRIVAEWVGKVDERTLDRAVADSLEPPPGG